MNCFINLSINLLICDIVTFTAIPGILGILSNGGTIALMVYLIFGL